MTGESGLGFALVPGMGGSLSLAGRATLAKVVGWVLAVPILAWALVFVALMYSAPDKFGEIFAALEVPLPPDTRLLLDIGGPGVAGLYGFLALLPVAALLRARRSWPKVVAPLACGAAMWVLNGVFFRALLTPLLPLFEKIQ
ncbi:MAG: hypothetical protein ACREIU_15840 [Planctomycetota bacterium]